MSFLSSNSQLFQIHQDQNINPNRVTTGSNDESRQNIDRKYSLYDNFLDQSGQNTSMSHNMYYGIGYGQNEEIIQATGYSSPDFVKKLTNANKGNSHSDQKPKFELQKYSLNQKEDDEEEENQDMIELRQNYNLQTQEQMIEVFKSNRKSSSNQWGLKNGILTSTNIEDNINHQDFLNGEAITSHHFRNATNMRSLGNYTSRPSSNLAIATQLANGTVSAGGFDHDIECEETDFKYLEEVIMKVKEGTDQQFHLSDYLEALIQESQIEQTEEWDAILAEAKEIQKTLKKVLDISCKIINIVKECIVFLLERTQLSSSENKSLSILNTQLLKELQISKDQVNSLNVEVRNSQNKIKQQYEAIKTQEENIKSLNEQIQSHLDLIRRLEKSSILSNTQSFGFANNNPGQMNNEYQEIVNQHQRKINELETYLAEQTSNYHSEVFKNEKLLNKIKEFQRNEEVLNIQIFQLERFKEEKDDKIFKLKDTKKRLKDEIIRKDMEIKNLKRFKEPLNSLQVNQGIVQLNRFSQSNLNITNHHEHDQMNYSYSTVTHQQDTTIIKHQRRGINLCGSQQKWSHELDVAVNKLRESKSGFLQRSFIVQQNIQEIQKAHHKRMQTISSNELLNSYQEMNLESQRIMSSPYQIKVNQSVAPRNNKILAQGSSSGNKIFDDSGTEIIKLQATSPDYKASAKKDLSRFQHSEESKFNINDHISPRKSNVYSNFNEDDEDDEVDSNEKNDDVVELHSVKNKRFGTATKNRKVIHTFEQTKPPYQIGINESDLMEFSNTSNNHIAATIINNSQMDYSYKLDETQKSIKNHERWKNQQPNPNKNQAGSSTTTKETKRDEKQSSGQTDKQMTVNNINITQNFGINNFVGEGQFVQSFKGSLQQQQQQENQNSSNLQGQNSSSKRKAKQNQSKNSLQNTSQQNQNKNQVFDSKFSLQSYGSINRGGGNAQSRIFEMQSFGNQINSPQKKNNKMGSQNSNSKLNYYNKKVNQIQIGEKLSEKSHAKNIYDELNCITVDQKDIEGDQINYHISQIDQEEQKSQILQELTSNNIKLEEQVSRIMMQQDILIEYFMISVLAFILKHPKRTTLQTIDKLNLYETAKKEKIPFFQWYKWIEKKMIEIYQEKKRQKKAQLRGTFFDPKSWFGKVKISDSGSNKINVIEDHFQTI